MSDESNKELNIVDDMPVEETQLNSLKNNPDLRVQAMHMYFSKEFFPTEIALFLNIDINELGEYIFGKSRAGTAKRCWYYMREKGQTPKSLSTYVSIKPMLIKKTESDLIDVVRKGINKIVNDEDAELTPDSITKLVSAYEKMDKIGRLEDGKATSHVINENRSFSLREIVDDKKRFYDDDIEDVEYEEIGDKEDEDKQRNEF
jgi:hypothetical protein